MPDMLNRTQTKKLECAMEEQGGDKMKSTYVFVLALAVALYCAPALAQHGHSGGMGGGMGPGATSMGHGADHGANTSNSTSTAHGKTMDQILTKNTQLSGKIQTLTGMSAQQACSNFRNLGQCVAAAHVSKNLGISFACLKADMTATEAPQGSSCPATTATKSKSMSLGQAIQTLSPNANSKTESKKAEKQAGQDLKETNS
jgi:hypothetical protein